jgi:hypothetical protein
VSMRATLTEGQFQQRIIDTAQTYGWRLFHARPARTNNGWTTPLTGDPGFPDLVLARRGQVLLVELKSNTGQLGPDQAEWLKALGPHGRLWRPRAWESALAELQGAYRS